MPEVKLHVTDLDEFFKGAMEGARRIDSGDVSEQPGVVAFESMETLLKVLTASRWQLLRTLRHQGKTSIRQLARLLERDYRAVHNDVHALMLIDLIERNDNNQIFVPWDRIIAEMAIDLAA
ncbi:transcriptional regulator [Rhizobium sp. AN80A]|uniref:HVO_A0114 family putative DNA-binding protein n=1 Tax=Rhizobium sp. AN80A TaxID=3040673 RepID=UPI0024B380A4|nr:transcriptional regulator [Rhizobium sp. AN80A]